MTIRLDRPAPRPTAPVATSAPAAAVMATKPAETAAPVATFERSSGFLHTIGEKLEGLVEKRFLVPHDGFMAVDKTGKVHAGVTPTAVEREEPRFSSPLHALMHVLAGAEHHTQLAFQAGNASVTGAPTGRDAEKGVTLDGALGKALAGSVDAKRGGLADLHVMASDGTKAAARVLVLPRDYDGPILVSDIDDTLRATKITDVLEGKTQPPMPGAREMVSGAAAMGVPVVYLSAGTTRIHDENEQFLAQLPKGILLDNPDFALKDLNPDNAAQARNQGAYKTAILQKLRETYPNAKIFGLGDDKYGDATAYTNVGARAFIHDVKADDANIPGTFTGVKTPAWSPAVQQQVLAELRAAVDASTSLKPA